MERFDVAVVGAGAAGMFCAGIAGQRGFRVVLIDHAAKVGEKIRISGGGRCNFTNLGGDDHRRYLSNSPRFARRALKAYPPSAFLALLARHRIGHHEKHLGQLFCDDGSQAIIDMLRTACDEGRVRWRHPVVVERIRRAGGECVGDRQAAPVSRGTGASADGFVVEGRGLSVSATHLVIATGGLSIPAIGATDFAWSIARQFGVPVVEPRPGLVPFTADPGFRDRFGGLSGLSLPVRIGVDGGSAGASGIVFEEDMLFTHRGLSGPAALQISSYWRPGQRLRVDLAPGLDIGADLVDAAGAATVSSRLASRLPKRLVPALLADFEGGERIGALPPVEVANASLRRLAEAIHRWHVMPAGTEGWKKAEVTCGGVDTAALDPASMAVRSMPGLYFIGEAVDVTGWLGGYNFQWAWASAHAAAMAIGEGAA